MDKLNYYIMAVIGGIGGAICSLFGGWTSAMTTLIIFMVVDYFTGMICAGVFKKSLKSENGGLESKAGFKGLCRKGVILLILLIACRLDILLSTDYLRDSVCIAFVVNEGISIIENAGLMGIPVPEILKKAISLLKDKEKK